MKKIILVGNTTWGMIKFRKNLITKLIEQNYEVIVISPYDKHVNEIKNTGCRYININMDNKGSNPLKDFKLIFDLKKIYIKEKADLIIHYTIKPNIYGSIASKLCDIKSFAVVTGLGFIFINDTFTSKIAKILYRFSFQFAEKVFFINNDDKKEFISNKLVNKNKVLILPGEGINTNLFKCFDKKENNFDKNFRFLLIARMLFDKGVEEYVQAADLLKNKYPFVTFGLVGYLDVDNPKAVTKKQMEIWQKNNNIIFYGPTDDVKTFISESDCIVLPSYREGISMILMESASMSKPLIATNVPGCKDLIDDNINGFLCEVKNSEDLALKMEKMLKLSSDERKNMGKAGREKMIKEFAESIVINKYLETIKEII